MFLLGQTVNDSVFEKVRHSSVFASLIDESTDITVTEQLLVYVAKYIDDKTGPKISFLGVKEVRFDSGFDDQ